MKSEWEVKPITNIVGFNPKHTVKKGALVSYVEMAAVPEHSREIAYFDNREFKSGSKFQNGDTLFSRITPCLQNGKTCRVSQLAKDEIANGSTEFIVMSAKNSIDKDFVYYLALSKEFRKYAEGRMEGTTGRQRVSWQSLSEYELPMPPKEIRKKISYTLSTLDDKIELNRRMNQTLEEMAQALFKSWFVDFDPVHAKNNATNDADYEQIAKELGISRKVLDLFPDKFEESGLGMIPTGWEVKKFGDIVIPKKGKSITKKTIIEGDVPVVAGGLTPAYYHNQFNVEAPVITISASGANAGFVNLYNTNIWASDCSYINSTNSDYVLTHYIYLRLKQSEITWMQQGAAQPHIYPSHLMRLDIVDAGTKIWDDFENLLTLMFKKIAINKTEAQTLQKIRDTLLPKLLSGELDVSELELDNVTH